MQINASFTSQGLYQTPELQCWGYNPASPLQCSGVIMEEGVERMEDLEDGEACDNKTLSGHNAAIAFKDSPQMRYSVRSAQAWPLSISS